MNFLKNVVLKNSIVLGSVEVYRIIINIAHSKIISVLLGPSGLGSYGLIKGLYNLVIMITGLGIERSSVKEIAQSDSDKANGRFLDVVTTVRNLLVLTGVVSSILTVAFAREISQITFGNPTYVFHIRILASVILLGHYYTGNQAVLRGIGDIKGFSYSRLLNQGLVLILGLLFYKNYGIIILPLAMFFGTTISILFTNKRISIGFRVREINKLDKDLSAILIQTGILLSLSSSISLIALYLIRIYISQSGGLDDVGYFVAGFAIINTYFGFLFASLSSDYYPRLSSKVGSNKEICVTVNEQHRVLLTLLSPLLVCFIILMNKIVPLLYDDDFMLAVPFMQIGVVGVFFQAISWVHGILYVAHGDAKYLLFIEFVVNSIYVLLSVSFYGNYGLVGLGTAFLITQILSAIGNLVLTRIVYNVKIDINKVIYIFGFLGIIYFAFRSVTVYDLGNTMSALIILMTLVYSLVYYKRA